MRRLCFALLLLLVFPVAGSCTRQEPAPAVTVDGTDGPVLRETRGAGQHPYSMSSPWPSL